jgi:F420-0:gamma-glutamyl ligase-like protein
MTITTSVVAVLTVSLRMIAIWWRVVVALTGKKSSTWAKFRRHAAATARRSKRTTRRTALRAEAESA